MVQVDAVDERGGAASSVEVVAIGGEVHILGRMHCGKVHDGVASIEAARAVNLVLGTRRDLSIPWFG